jgi:hypothetical protein
MGGPVTDDVTHYQEVVGESFLSNDAEFQVQTVLELAADDRITAAGSLKCQLLKLSKRRTGVRHPRRHDTPPDRDGIGTALRDLFGAAQGIGAVGKMPGQLLVRAEPRLGRPDLVSGKLGESGVEGNGAEQTMAAPSFGMGGDDAVRGDRGQTQPPSGGQGFMALPTGPELSVQVLGAAEPEDFLEKTDMAGEKDEAVSVSSQ